MSQKYYNFCSAITSVINQNVIFCRTETVYGLAVSALSSQAVQKAMAIKNRVATKAMTVHYAHIEDAMHDIIPSKTLDILIDAFLPGPMTILLPVKKHHRLPNILVPNGIVGIRIPSDDIANNFLHAVGIPIAASSANISGCIPCTNSDHIHNVFDNQSVPIVGSEYCLYGIDSTIIDITGNIPKIIRSGPISIQDIRNAGLDGVECSTQHASVLSRLFHIRMNATYPEHDEYMIGFGNINGNVNLSSTGDLLEAAQQFYAIFHKLLDMNITKIAVAPIPQEKIGQALNDRLIS